jgi:hypothetical protein
MRSVSAILTDLIGFTEEVIAKRPSGSLAGIDRFAALAAEVREADAKPSIGERATSAAIVIVTALEEFKGSERDMQSPWLMVVGATLPLLRAGAWLALKNEKEAAGESRR